ncbi:MAG: lamin tail domain-containing protein [Kofleriaceae bacterium]
MRLRRLVAGIVVAGWGVLGGCAEAPRGGGDGPGYEREVRGGNLHRAPVEGVTADAVDLDRVLATAAPLATAFGSLRGRDFTVEARPMTTQGPALTAIYARQTQAGVPVHGAYAYLVAKPGAADGQLVASSYHLYQGVDVATAPTLARGDAMAEARRYLRQRVDAGASADLAIWPVDGELQLVWEVVVTGRPERVLVVASGVRAGHVQVTDERVYQTTGHVRGWVATAGAPGGAGTPTLLALPETTVTAGPVTTTTDGQGGFLLDAPPGSTVTSTLAGPAALVANRAGAVVSAGAPAAAQVDLTLAGPGAGEFDLAQTTAYYYVTRARQFLAANGVAASALGAPLPVNVNLTSTCNAYFSPATRDINFFRSGGGCRNSAEGSIIAHEYGHFVDDTFGGIVDGGLSEGWGDVLACLMFQAPVVGGDLLPGGDIIRTCDNPYRYPASGRDEVHALGQAWAGFVWHARAGLMASLGASQGDALIRALVIPSFTSNAPDIPTAVREVFLRDDDDGDLANRTPHWDVLMAAAEQHGLGFVVSADLSPPAAVVDLAVTAVGATSATLTWTAPGDDGDAGTAAAYDLRWASQPITEANFAAATPVAAPAPTVAGTTQTTTAEVPAIGTVYFALTARDELGNVSPLSNLATAALASSTVVFVDGAEAGLGGWEATGLWHVTGRRAAEGASAFWYGDEATGTYDTGSRNAGTLTSPVIDLTGVTAPRLSVEEWIEVEPSAGFDQLTIEVFDVAQPALAVVAAKATGSSGGVFAGRLLDLAPLAGRQVRIRFTVDTVDDGVNDLGGWYVDHVQVLADDAPPPPPPAPGQGHLIINEVLADPPTGYDANGDGVWSVRDDEYVELVNTGDAPVDLGGATIADAVAARHTFAAGTVVAPGQALVVFGGPAPALAGVVTVGTAGLYLNNDGDQVVVRTAPGLVVAQLRYGPEGGADQSLTRQVDGDGASPMVGHRSVAATPAAPGRRADGTPFPRPSAGAARLVIAEVLADPPAGYDANGDGVASAVDDEFIELWNAGDGALDLGGATVSDAVAVRGTFPAGTRLLAGQRLVVFGGGTAAVPGVAGLVMGPLQLNNGGDSVTVRAADGSVLTEVRFDATAGMDQSLVRWPEPMPDAPMVLHRGVSSLPASPGVAVDGRPF